MEYIRGISKLTLGTAGLGQSYAGLQPPLRYAARALLMRAVADGCTFIDTAPTYGTEELVGRALYDLGADSVGVATKIAPRWRRAPDIFRALDLSRTALRRDRIDVVQLHNPLVGEIVAGARTFDALREARERGWLKWIGASVYTVAEAFTAIPFVDIIQVPYNLIDQRMRANGVFDFAREKGVLVLARSPWLRGMLTSTYNPTAPNVAQDVAERVRKTMLCWHRDSYDGCDGYDKLASVALRFALDGPDSVVCGPLDADEWSQAVSAVNAGRLPWWRRALSACCASSDPNVYDPRRWEEPDRCA